LVKYKKLIIFTLLIGVLGIAIMGCSQKGDKVATDKAKDNNGVAEEAIPVEVIEAKIGGLRNYVTVMGEAQAFKSVKVTPEVQARLERKYVEVSDRVEKGDKLLELEADVYQAQVDQAAAGLAAAKANLNKMLLGTKQEKIDQLEAKLEQAKTSYEEAKKAYERQQELYKKSVISKQRLERSKTQYVSAKAGYEFAQKSLKLARDGATKEEIEAMKAQVAQAKAGLKVAKLKSDKTTLTAPISGIISSVNIEEGELAAMSPVISIVNIDKVKIMTYVSEQYVNRLENGQKVEVEFSAINEVFTGKISSISPMADQRKKRFPVEILINNDENLIKAGMFGEVQAKVDSSIGKVVILQDAVLSDRDGDIDYVYVAQNGQAVRKEVETGLMSNGEIVILSGMEPGDNVIIRGQNQLSDEAKIKLINRGGQ
jgi:multidrug efflux pump subunit AcrA (membrane-fusion protein)